MNIFNLVLIIILVAFIAIGAIIGLLKGFTRSLFTVFTNIAAGLCALFIARPIIKALISLPLFADIIRDFLSGTSFSSSAEGLIDILSAIVSAFAAPALFMILYLLLYLILKLPFYLIYKACNKNHDSPNKPLGAVICAVNSIIFYIFLFAPLAGYYHTGITVADSFRDLPEDSPIAAITEITGVTIETEDIFALDLVYSSGGKAIFNHLSSIKYEDETVFFSEEISTLSHIALNAAVLAEGMETGDDIDTEACVNEITSSFSKSILLKGLTIESLKALAVEWQNGSISGDWLLTLEEYDLLPVVDKLADIYANCDSEMIAEDFATIASILGTLSGSELLDTLNSTEEELPANDIIALAADENLLYGIILALYENPRLNPLLPALSDSAVIFLCTTTGVDPEGAPKNPTSMSSITADDIKAEAASLAIAFKGLGDVFAASEAGTLPPLNKLADAVGGLEDSFLFGHAVSYITFALLKDSASESLENFGISSEVLDKLSENPNVNVSTVLNVAESVSDIVSVLKEEKTDTTIAEAVENVSSTIVSMDTETTKALAETIPSDFLETQGINVDNATIQQELENYYTNNKDTFEDADVALENLENIANIFGIDLFNK